MHRNNILSKLLQKFKRKKLKGQNKNPFFYFGVFSLFLLIAVSFGYENLSDFNDNLKNSKAVFFNSFFNNADAASSENLDPFFAKNEAISLETPDLKIMQDNTVFGISTPRILTTQVLGAIFGESSSDKKSVTEYVVAPGDTMQSIADNFEISLSTLLWVNDLTKNSTLKVGQQLIILPVSGLTHIVKNGDTISDIAKKYKAKDADIIAFNNLTNEGDIFIGDILIVPGGIMPQKASPAPTYAPLAESFFIFPTEGTLTQGLHWYNAVDIANKCGTPVYAAASGTVQRAKYGWNFGGGNLVTILHSSGVVTYYGHLMTILVKPGDTVSTGDRIALMGGGKGMAGAGISTGCHTHFEVIGAKNPLSKYLLGSKIKFK